jgi:pyruvate dehydrogenase E1 component
MRYLRERRERSAASCRSAVERRPLEIPALEAFETRARGLRRARDLDHHGLRAHADHAAARQEHRQEHRADRARRGRTFGMEGMFRQLGIYNPWASSTSPQDSDQLMYYKEDKTVRCSRRASTRPARCSWIAAATSYASHGVPMIPFYIYYSMFGFQRIGDLAWAAGDMQARGFLIGGTAGPHHAERRRPAAPGRPQPHPGRHHPELRQPTTRPSLRTGGDHPGRPERMLRHPEQEDVYLLLHHRR